MKNITTEESTYSRHFRTLRVIGAWVVLDPNNRLILISYSVYKTVMTFVAILACGSLFLDFYLVFGDFKKMTWNLCISTLFSGSFMKNIYNIYKSDVIIKLRTKLHHEESSRETPEDESLNVLSLKELKYVRIFFYGFGSISIPLWLVTRYISYYWGPRDIPVPFRIPIEINFDDEWEYNISFALVGLIGCVGLLLVLETELAMFSILIQISREYKKLLKDINRINYLYDEYSMSLNFEYSEIKKEEVEVNPWLRKIRTKMLVKEFSSRQQHLIEYTNDFERCYGLTMLLQSFVLSLVLIVSAIQCILEYGNFSMNLSYQIGYIIILLMDMFLLCWYASRIRDQGLILKFINQGRKENAREKPSFFFLQVFHLLTLSLFYLLTALSEEIRHPFEYMRKYRVGEEFYSTLWYRMSTDIQRDICTIIMRSQKPPKLTFGKVMEVNLHAFMILTRNIYSWLTLFQQLEFKFSVKEKQ